MGDALEDHLLEQVRLATEAVNAIAALRKAPRVGFDVPTDAVLAEAEYGVRGIRDLYVGELDAEIVAELIEEFTDDE